jgi:hypothetical protein
MIGAYDDGVRRSAAVTGAERHLSGKPTPFNQREK